MNFFDRIFGKQEAEKKSEKRIALTEVIKLLENKRNERSEKSRKEAKPIMEKISFALFEIREIAKGMKEKEISENIPQRARKIILMSAPQFVQSLTESVSFDYKTDIATFQKNLDLCLDKVGKLLVGKGRYLPIAFSDEIERIGKRANEVLNYRDELRKRTPKDEKLENAASEYEKIRNHFEKLKELEKNRETANAILEEIKKEKPSLEKNLDEMEKSSELKEFLHCEDELKKLQSETEEIRNKVNNYLSPLQRPLKKFEKLSESSGNKQKEVKSYIENPVEGFFSDEIFEIGNILRDLNSATLSKKLDLKPQEEKKVSSAFENLEEIKKIRKRYEEITSEEKNIKEKLANAKVVKEKNEILKSIEKLNRDIMIQESEIKKINANISEMKEDIMQEKKVLEDFLGEIEGKDISVVVNFQV